MAHHLPKNEWKSQHCLPTLPFVKEHLGFCLFLDSVVFWATFYWSSSLLKLKILQPFGVRYEHVEIGLKALQPFGVRHEQVEIGFKILEPFGGWHEHVEIGFNFFATLCGEAWTSWDWVQNFAVLWGEVWINRYWIHIHVWINISLPPTSVFFPCAQLPPHNSQSTAKCLNSKRLIHN